MIRLYECKINEKEMEDLAACIDHPDSTPQLTDCNLWKIPIPSSMLTSLSKCKQLMHLTIMFCDLGSRLHILLIDPPPLLEVLRLSNLYAEDVRQMADCVKHNKLPHLRELNIRCNCIGEAAVGCLLKAFLDTRVQDVQRSNTDEEKRLFKALATTRLQDGRSILEAFFTTLFQDGSCSDEAVRVHLEAFLAIRGEDGLRLMKECYPTRQISVDTENNEVVQGKVSHTVELDLRGTADVGEGEHFKNLSNAFIEEWEQKLRNTNIIVKWKW